MALTHWHFQHLASIYLRVYIYETELVCFHRAKMQLHWPLNLGDIIKLLKPTDLYVGCLHYSGLASDARVHSYPKIYIGELLEICRNDWVVVT